MHKVLIVDDNQDFAELLESFLNASGYNAYAVFDGNQGIEKIKRNCDYDLIITDVIMPNKDGFDMVDFVKGETNAKIIAISGGGILLSGRDTIAAISDKVDACLEKPVNMKDILACIEKTLAQ